MQLIDNSSQPTPDIVATQADRPSYRNACYCSASLDIKFALTPPWEKKKPHHPSRHSPTVAQVPLDFQLVLVGGRVVISCNKRSRIDQSQQQSTTLKGCAAWFPMSNPDLRPWPDQPNTSVCR
jgi:hypothetical protein